MNIVKYHSIKKINREALVNMGADIDWYIYLETYHNSYEFTYYAFYRGNELVAVLTGFVLRKLDVQEYIPEKYKKIINGIRIFNRQALYYDVYFIVKPLSSGEGIYIKDKNNDNVTSIFIKFLAYCYTMENYDSVYITNLYQVNLLNALEKNNFVSFDFYPNTVLQLKSENFNDYLKTLKKKKRWDIKNKMKKMKEYGIEFQFRLAKEISEEYYLSIYKLYLNTKNKSNAIASPINYDFESFKGLRNLCTNYKFILFEYGGELVAFGLIVVHNETEITLKHVGMDYVHSVPSYAYFNIFYLTIQFAIENKHEKIYFGSTTYDVKKDIGCELIPNKSLINFNPSGVGKLNYYLTKRVVGGS
ncbi:hypothetical protein BHT95_01640 [Bacillus paralicheniformis]|uniref:peptidogalycan biosysnthesis protein n=1 Tax=Bacillus TaxID=1386 RepID=UPI000950BA2C|nr:peptidogalycan biosysnthesis protein [Bacillus paralicheniformis]OLQ54014.1 hypothetical protein BHT95_01640 [Bacillus paralicheniformis]TWM58874.1 hypothetical protein CHCC14814_1063 [Bacillus paralicheniformis]